MTASFLWISVWLIIGIAAIVLLTTTYKVHSFFALLIACVIVGLGVGIPLPEIINTAKDGFGNIMKSLALIIVLGTTLGVILEHTGSTRAMAGYILKVVGERRAPLALSITGLIVGLPVFCDSGYIVLSGLNKSISKRTGIPLIVLATSMATGLYSVHCMIPPHPGASAAAGVIGVDFGKLILLGSIVAIPAMLIAYGWAVYTGKNDKSDVKADPDIKEEKKVQLSPLQAFLPVIIPVLLIALRSGLSIDPLVTSGLPGVFNLLGDPVIALAVGIVLAILLKRKWKRTELSYLLGEAVEKAGGILVIIGGGGAFGALLGATKIGLHFSQAFALGSIGILFPFLLTAVLKTAQGSSTVAIITAASIVQPLLPALGMETEKGRLLAVLAMGAGSMMISHANDAYFWVIAKFTGLEMRPMLKTYSVATLLMGIGAFLMVYILSFFL